MIDPTDSKSAPPATGSGRSASARFGPWLNLAELGVILLVAFFLLRVAMLCAFTSLRGLGVLGCARVFLAGLRFDLLVTLIVLLPQSLQLAALGGRAGARWHRWLAEAEWLIVFLTLPFLCVAEFLFFWDIRSRLNYIAFEYLVYPTEVCCSIWQSYPTWQILLVVAVVGFGLYVVSRERFLRRLGVPVSASRRAAILASGVALLATLAVTTNIDTMAATADREANECAGNGLYTLAYHAWTCRVDYEQLYRQVDEGEAVAILRGVVALPGDRFQDGSRNPLDRVTQTHRPRNNWNVVIILEESFGSEFVGALGAKQLQKHTLLGLQRRMAFTY